MREINRGTRNAARLQFKNLVKSRVADPHVAEYGEWIESQPQVCDGATLVQLQQAERVDALRNETELKTICV